MNQDKFINILYFSIIILFIIFTIFSFRDSEAFSKSNEKTIYGVVEKVKDGDTINIDGSFNIRLLGIDAPEKKQTCETNGKVWKCGEKSTEYLKNLVLNKKLSCKYKKKEKYGRYLAVCFLKDKNINEEMVRSGMAIAYMSKDFLPQQDIARIEKKGIWSSNFINPSDFRHNKKS